MGRKNGPKNPMVRAWLRAFRLAHLRRLDSLQDRRGRHAVADAHDLKPELRFSPLQLVEQLRHQNRTRRAQWVPVRDGAAVRIYDGEVGMELLRPSENHACESLVDLDDGHVLE